MGKHTGKNICRSLSSKYSQIFDHDKESATNLLNAVEATGDSTGNKIVDKIAKASKKSPRNISEIGESKTEVLIKIYLPPKTENYC